MFPSPKDCRDVIYLLLSFNLLKKVNNTGSVNNMLWVLCITQSNDKPS